MTYRLTCIISHPTWDEPMEKVYEYVGSSKRAIIEQIDTLPYHRHRLSLFGGTRFKDVHGATHKWSLEKVPEH